MLKAVLIDDEQDNITALQIKLSMVCPEVTVVASFINPKDFFLFLNENEGIDVLFLDVEMPAINGLQLLETLPARNYEVIMVTAYAEYALQAIKASALDYLLKPVEYDELRKAVNKVIERRQKEKLLNQQMQVPNHLNKIALHTTDGLQFVQPQEIIKCESLSNYSKIYLTSLQKITITKTLKEVEEILIPYKFYRIHNSYIINLEHIKKYIKADGGFVLMSDGEEIKVARNRKDGFLEKFAAL